MDRIAIRINGKEIEALKGSRISEVIPAQGEHGYDSDPIVAAAVNGIARSLSERLEGNAEIKPIHLFSRNGLRAYRKSLCFLLSYATSVIAPERTLIIGHSLGDGYYFRYRDGRKGDRDRLEEVMRSAIEKDIPFEIVELTAEEALAYSKEHLLTETESLTSLSCHPRGILRDGSYGNMRMGFCCAIPSPAIHSR